MASDTLYNFLLYLAAHPMPAINFRIIIEGACVPPPSQLLESPSYINLSCITAKAQYQPLYRHTLQLVLHDNYLTFRVPNSQLHPQFTTYTAVMQLALAEIFANNNLVKNDEGAMFD